MNATGHVYPGGKPVTRLLGGPCDGMVLDQHMFAGDECRVPKRSAAVFMPNPDTVPTTTFDDAYVYRVLTSGLAVWVLDRRRWRIYAVRLEVDLGSPGADDPALMATMLEAMPPGVTAAPVVAWRDDKPGVRRTYVREGLVRSS